MPDGSGLNRSTLIGELAGAGLLPPGETPWGDHERWVVDAGEQLLSFGLDVPTIARLVRIGRQVASLEVAALVAEVGAGVPATEALERETVRREAVARFIAATRYGAVSKAMRRLTGLSEPFHAYAGEQLHAPSALFLNQHGLHTSEERLRDRAEAGDGAASRLLGRLLIGLGRYAEAANCLSGGAAGASDADAAVVQSHLAVAHAFLGDPDAARAAANRAVELSPTALTLAFAAVVRAYSAGLAEDLFSAMTLVSEALDLLERSRRAPVLSALEQVECQLTRGRVSVILPPDFGIHQKGKDDLAAVLAATVRPLAGVPAGATEIFRLNAAYFLGLAHSEAGQHADARALLQEVLLIDPACAFAERAYRRLSELPA